MNFLYKILAVAIFGQLTSFSTNAADISAYDTFATYLQNKVTADNFIRTTCTKAKLARMNKGSPMKGKSSANDEPCRTMGVLQACYVAADKAMKSRDNKKDVTAANTACKNTTLGIEETYASAKAAITESRKPKVVAPPPPPADAPPADAPAEAPPADAPPAEEAPPAE